MLYVLKQPELSQKYCVITAQNVFSISLVIQVKIKSAGFQYLATTLLAQTIAFCWILIRLNKLELQFTGLFRRNANFHSDSVNQIVVHCQLLPILTLPGPKYGQMLIFSLILERAGRFQIKIRLLSEDHV